MNRDKKIVYLILGGSEINMKKRCQKTIELLKEQNDIVLASGFKKEVIWIKKYCREYGVNVLCLDGSWDTYTNIKNDLIPYLESLKNKSLDIPSTVIAPTGHLHGKRARLAWSMVCNNTYKSTTFECPYSGEEDGKNEEVLYSISKFKLGILLLSFLAKILRREW